MTEHKLLAAKPKDKWIVKCACGGISESGSGTVVDTARDARQLFAAHLTEEEGERSRAAELLMTPLELNDDLDHDGETLPYEVATNVARELSRLHGREPSREEIEWMIGCVDTLSMRLTSIRRNL